MDPRRAPFNDICGSEWRQILQPETGALGFGMPELPGLDALRELDVIPYQVLRVRMHDRVFDADVRDRRIPEI